MKNHRFFVFPWRRQGRVDVEQQLSLLAAIEALSVAAKQSWCDNWFSLLGNSNKKC